MRFFLVLSLFWSVVLSQAIDDSLTQNNQILNEFNLKKTFIQSTRFEQNYQALENYYKDKNDKNSNFIFASTIGSVLEQKGLPKSLLYLAVAESRLIPTALSNKKAAGVWQLMPEAATYYGLSIDAEIDERYDIERSTDVAASYLLELYAKFGKWYLAAAAYNGGATRVMQGIVEARIDMYCQNKKCKKDPEVQQYKKTLAKYKANKINAGAIAQLYTQTSKWRIDPDANKLFATKNNKGVYLPTESVKFVENIVALAMIDTKFKHLESESVFANRTLTKINLQGGFSLSKIAGQIGLYENDLKSLNMHLKNDYVGDSKRVYTLYLPSSRIARYNRANGIESNEKYLVYEVKVSDTIKKIANIYGVSQQRLLDINYVDDSLMPTQRIVIPVVDDIAEKKVATLKISNLWRDN